MCGATLASGGRLGNLSGIEDVAIIYVFMTALTSSRVIEQEKSRHPDSVQALMTSIRDCYDTEEMALEQNQFRFKDFIDQQTGEVLVKLFFQNYHENPLPRL